MTWNENNREFQIKAEEKKGGEASWSFAGFTLKSWAGNDAPTVFSRVFVGSLSEA
jgi:hypothetical protein